ncbi:MAG: hypothetical protein JO291_10990 [Acidimicrobiia bacterium]|nr:hypothetical protein [Acidimicrobiia bacterium]
MRRSDLVAAAIAAVVVAGFLCGVRIDNLHNGLLALSFAGVGAFVLHRRPDHREAQLFVAAGAAQAVLFAGRQVGETAPSQLGRATAEWLGWLGVWPLPLVMVLVGLTIMGFPDGRLPGPAWRVAFASTAVAGAVLAVASALWALDYERAEVATAPPFVAPGADALRGSFHGIEVVVFPVFQVIWLACVIGRRARATPDEARQLRWLIASVALSAVVLLVGVIVAGSPRAGLLTLPLIPLAAGFAIVESAYEALVSEVRTATQRVVAAQDDARRQIEQDLHDGAQHRLVVLGMELGRLVDQASERGDAELAGAARAARDQLLEATAELRELARGIHPSVLTHDGLVPALQSLVERSSVPVDMDIDAIPACDPQVEIAAYYAVSEALTNTVRHGRASRSTVRVTTCDDELRIEVADDGDGGARMGRGLRGLADRVQSVGGRLTLDSSAGAGTRVIVELPCR